MSSPIFLAKVNQFKFWDRGYSNFPNICFTPNHEYIERVLGWKLDTREQWCHKLPKRKPQKLGTFQKMKRWNWLIADHVAPVSGSVARYESLQRFQRDETFSKNCKDKDKRKLGTGGATHGQEVIKLIAATKEEIKSLWVLADVTHSEAFPRIAKTKTNANLAINVSTHNANWGQEGWCCTQGQEVIKLIAPTKRINCSHQTRR